VNSNQPAAAFSARRRCIAQAGRLALLGLVLAGAFALLDGVRSVRIPAFAEVVAGAHLSEATLLDRNGLPLQRLRLDTRRRQLDWVPLDQVSPALVEALIAAEDQRFFRHAGVDLRAIGSSLIDDLLGARRGASTISMQVAALLFDEPRGAARRTLLAKIGQIQAALALERRWTKRQILEAYVNLVSFRNDLVGVQAASLGLLRIGPGGLDEAQSAVLAALVRAPAAQRALIGRRACRTLKAMRRDDACTEAQFVATGLPPRPWPIIQPGLNDAEHLARRLLTAPGQRVRSTLDAGLQRFAAETLRSRLAELEGRNVEDGAIVVIDNASGDVLAYVGSSGALSEAEEVDGVMALRQPGSTLKPFIYAEALQRRWLTAASVLDDAPFAVETPAGLYAPQNYEKDFKGAVSVRTALASSLNVPAVRALELVGVADLRQRLQELGFESLNRPAEHYGLGLALGDGEVTLLQLANAYRALANGGNWTPARLRTDDAPSGPPRRVFSQAASFIIADILADSAARAPTFGFASPLSARTWAAVKTGTSKGMRDNWAVGFTDRYTVAVWVGNASGAPMWDVSGVTGAAPAWQAIVDHLHDAAAAVRPKAPAGVSMRSVQFASGFEAGRQEWFITGTEAGRIELPAADVRPRLIEPADGTRIAPDPDIPLHRQKIRVRANTAADPGFCLLLDQRPLSRCGLNDVLMPLPAPGHHRLALTDRVGNVAGEIGIEVRPVPRVRGATVF
jgi:penicillin-binding protein 1C